MQLNDSKIRIMGWDPANRSLAWAVIDIYPQNIARLLNKSARPGQKFIEIVAINCADLTHGFKLDEVSETERTISLKQLLQSEYCAAYCPDIVVIERQRAVNGLIPKSAKIAAQIEYHYAGLCRIEYISPQCKNKYSLGGIYCTNPRDYKARKAHTANMLDYVFTTLNCRIAINKEYKDDMADALFTALVQAEREIKDKIDMAIS